MNQLASLGVGGGGFSPLSLSGLALWLKGDAGTLKTGGGAAASGDPVATWQDQSGNSYDVTQATTAAMPTLLTGAQNGLPVLSFDGTDDYLRSVVLPSAATQSIYVMVKSLNSGASYLLDFGDAAHSIIQGFTAGDWEWYSTPRTVIGAISTTVFQVISTLLGGHGAVALTIGATGAANNIWGGGVGEVIVYNRGLTTAEDAQVKAYLASKWGL